MSEATEIYAQIWIQNGCDDCCLELSDDDGLFFGMGYCSVKEAEEALREKGVNNYLLMDNSCNECIRSVNL